MSQEVLIRVQPTPNPNAWKFVLDRPVLLQGKASFSNKEECGEVRLATDLLSIDGIRQVHFFENVITVTSRFDQTYEELGPSLLSVIQTRLPIHDPAFNQHQLEKKKRDHLPEDVQKIEEILDRTIRPGLQGDGGDIEIIKFESNQIYIHYQGACGTCPSSTTGTLMAIESILRDEMNNQAIEVIPV